MVRYFHHALFVQHDGLGQHAIKRYTQGRVAPRWRAIEPDLEESPSHAVSLLKTSDSGANGGDLPGAVRERDGGAAHWSEVLAVDDQVIAVVERRGSHSNHDFARPRLRVGARGATEAARRGRSGVNFVDLHGCQGSMGSRRLRETGQPLLQSGHPVAFVDGVARALRGPKMKADC